MALHHRINPTTRSYFCLSSLPFLFLKHTQISISSFSLIFLSIHITKIILTYYIKIKYFFQKLYHICRKLYISLQLIITALTIHYLIFSNYRKWHYFIRRRVAKQLSIIERRLIDSVVGNFHHCLEVKGSTHVSGREIFFVCMIKKET